MEATASTIFNSTILGYLLLLFDKLALFGEFQQGTTLGRLAAGRRLDQRRLHIILDTAVAMGMLTHENSIYRLTDLGRELERSRGFFTWAIGGYSPLLEHMDVFLEAPTTGWRTYTRGDYVALGSDECNEEIMAPVIARALGEIDFECVADLGCGNAGRLVALLNSRPDLTGIGIDIDPGAIRLASLSRDAQGLRGRLHLVQEDVFTTLNETPVQLESVDVVMSFMMLHDLFNNPDLGDGELFRKMKAAFPRAKYFLMADTCAAETLPSFPDTPIFTAGYELVHALRGIQTFPLAFYHEQFIKGRLKLTTQYKLGVPNTYLFVLET